MMPELMGTPVAGRPGACDGVRAVVTPGHAKGGLQGDPGPGPGVHSGPGSRCLPFRYAGRLLPPEPHPLGRPEPARLERVPQTPPPGACDLGEEGERRSPQPEPPAAGVDDGDSDMLLLSGVSFLVSVLFPSSWNGEKEGGSLAAFKRPETEQRERSLWNILERVHSKMVQCNTFPLKRGTPSIPHALRGEHHTPWSQQIKKLFVLWGLLGGWALGNTGFGNTEVFSF